MERTYVTRTPAAVPDAAVRRGRRAPSTPPRAGSAPEVPLSAVDPFTATSTRIQESTAPVTIRRAAIDRSPRESRIRPVAIVVRRAVVDPPAGRIRSGDAR